MANKEEKKRRLRYLQLKAKSAASIPVRGSIDDSASVQPAEAVSTYAQPSEYVDPELRRKRKEFTDKPWYQELGEGALLPIKKAYQGLKQIGIAGLPREGGLQPITGMPRGGINPQDLAALEEKQRLAQQKLQEESLIQEASFPAEFGQFGSDVGMTLYPAAKGAQIGGLVPKATTFLKGLGAGFGSAGVHQLQELGERGEVSPGSAIAETLASGILPIAGKYAKPFVKGVMKAPGKYGGMVAEEVGTVPLEGLKMWGTKEGKKALKKSWQQELPTARKLVDKVMDVEKTIPETKQIGKIINKMPKKIIADDVMDEIGRAIQKVKLQTTNKYAIKKLQNLASDFANVNVSPATLRAKRIELDDIIDWDKPGAKLLDNLLKGPRAAIEKTLVKNAPKEYKGVMKNYANKLQKVAAIKGKLGNRKSTAEERAFSLLRTVDNDSRQPVKEMLIDFDDVFKTDFTKKAELMHMGRMLGKPGKAELDLPLLPKTPTGNRWVALMTAGLGSPRIAPTLLKGLEKPGQLYDLVESGAGKLGKLTPKISPEMKEQLNLLGSQLWRSQQFGGN